MIRAVPLILAAVSAMAGGGIHYSALSDDPVFYRDALRDAPAYRAGLSTLAGGIVSHHLLASREMAGFFMAVKGHSEVGEKRVRTIVIIGPDHGKRVVPPLVTSLLPWKTPGGFVHADAGLFAALNSGGIGIDDGAVADEHSIGSLTGFMGTLLPGVKVLPLVVGGALSWEGAREMGKRLARHAGSGTMVLVSTDFVHDRSSAEAARLDETSRRLLEDPAGSLTVQRIAGMTCDCRKGAFILFSFLAERGMLRCRVLGNTDSGRITGLDIPVTSYFYVLYGE